MGTVRKSVQNWANSSSGRGKSMCKGPEAEERSEETRRKPGRRGVENEGRAPKEAGSGTFR